MRPTSRTTRTIYFVIFALVFVVSIPILVLYSMGYSLDISTFTPSGRGAVLVSVPESDVDVYIGNELKRASSIFQKEIFVKGISPNKYLILVSNDKYWPWAKSLEISAGEVTVVRPLLVPRTTIVDEVVKGSLAYKDLENLFSSEPKRIIASAQRALANSITASQPEGVDNSIYGKNIRIWKSESDIFASWLGDPTLTPPYFCDTPPCQESKRIFTAFSPVGRIDFYPGRDDAIIITLDDSVYAMEIDSRPYHNFFPLYKGTKPDFRIERQNLYIKDGDKYFTIEI